MTQLQRSNRASSVFSVFTYFNALLAITVSLLPLTASATEQETPLSTVFDIVNSNPKLLTFRKALDRTGLSSALKLGGDITVFAPTNEAFDQWPADELAKLFAHPAALTTLVELHLVDGTIDTKTLRTRQYLVTRLGRLVSVMMDDPYILINDARIVDGDRKASNGVVHMIDTVLEP